MKPLRLILASASALSLLAAPASLAAQDTEETVDMVEAAPPEDEMAEDDMAEDPMAALMGMMGGMIEVEPLTAEQQARMPAAEAIIARIMPPGAMAELSQSMMGGFFGSFGDILNTGPKPALAELIGVNPLELDGVSDDQAREAASLLDPAWEERQSIVTGLMPEMLGEMMNAVEPSMRRAMAELYAIRFTPAELTAIDTFFATETGGKYARESLSMASDKRMLAASMEAMPAVFTMIGQMEERMKARTESLPAPRAFGDLDEAEKAKVAALTGYSVEEIESNIEANAAIAEETAEEVTVD
ncbi:DUF2059 domain-containing protein [Porphyrobacter sp. YT40]|uniref:DUF2059 domain-containing protein n=1 Tax=Porphyrobacter sp. YT40 TaxID=2547601 RepID=UPI0011439FF8|nr:DUF2059 domain-containing protein [Porphyrobacter sp. YT40]QDH33591.1 DUF2059 domain-containing protein [Porphyrobacter sp. YT40]